MKKDLSSLTGADILSAVRKRHRRIRVWCIVGIIAACAAIVAGVIMMRKGEDMFFGILMLLFGAIGIYVAFTEFSKSGKAMKDAENCRVFRKFGSPESIAAKIAEECSTPVLDAKGVLVCDSFIVQRNNFETYVPFSEALLIYRVEHRTNGIKDGVSLAIHDSYGDKQQFPFQLGKRGQEQMQELMQRISEKNERCAFGYSQQNLAYARQNAQTLSEDRPEQ